jgi:membrane protein YqaA with SNARE-associated domain
MKKVLRHLQGLQKFIHRWWYGPLFFFFCGIDHYIVFIPVLGMLVSTVLLSPKKWLPLSLWGGIGSGLGGWSVGWVARTFGFSLIQEHFPDLMKSGVWIWAENFFSHHGVWVVFISGVSPITQQPALIISSLAGAPLWEIGVVFLVAKVIKFTLVGYLASHAPQYLGSFRSVQHEMENLNVEAAGTKRNSLE